MSGKDQVQTDKIRTAIQQLADRHYWDAFETEEPAEPERPLSSTSRDWLGPSVPLRETIGDKMQLQIREVRADGWLMEDTWLKEDSAAPSKDPFMRLPPDIAKLGRKGTQFSLMHLELRKGIWRPVGAYGEDMVVGTVYGP